MLHTMRTWLRLLYSFTFVALTIGSEYDYTSFHKIVRCKAPNGLFTPNSTQDVISIVKQAAAANQTVRVVTANKWSITDVLCELYFSSFCLRLTYLVPR